MQIRNSTDIFVNYFIKTAFFHVTAKRKQQKLRIQWFSHRAIFHIMQKGNTVKMTEFLKRLIMVSKLKTAHLETFLFTKTIFLQVAAND